MANRPFTFPIFCARAKNKIKIDGATRYGSYPAGFLESARELLVRGDPNASIWHIPGGIAHGYNGSYGGILLTGYGKNDKRIDIDPKVKPDVLFDIRNMSEIKTDKGSMYIPRWGRYPQPDAVIIDLDYSKSDAAHRDDPSTWPDNLNEVTRQGLRIVKKGGLVGVLDEKCPRPGTIRYVKTFQIPVLMPDGNRPRLFTIWRNIYK